MMNLTNSMDHMIITTTVKGPDPLRIPLELQGKQARDELHLTGRR